jgi:putative ABC transport system permease protein
MNQLSHNMRLPVSLRFALRELRTGLKGFRVFMACLILGVTAIAAVGSLTQAIKEGLLSEGQAILGGDIEVSMFRSDISDEQRIWLSGQGILSQSTRMRTMARSQVGESTLVELRSIDRLYPLYGEFLTSPPLSNDALFAKRDGVWGTVIETALASRLNVGVGDTLDVGTIKISIRALINKEPDKANLGFQLGPSVMVYNAAMIEAGLKATGSLIDHYYKLKLPADVDIKTWREAADKRYPDERWSIQDSSGAAPGMRRFINRMSMFLTLVGLTALVVGGVGVSNAVKGYMDRKTKTIATLKILGASGNSIFMIYFIQVIMLGLIAIAIGLIAGAMLPDILILFLPDSLPISPEQGIYPQALFMAAFYGLLITIAFTTWPLGKARDLPAVRLFRALVAPDKQKPRTIYQVVVYGAALMVVALAIVLADNIALASGFIAGALISLMLLRGTSSIIEKIARKMPRPKNALRRLALANIHRPGSATSAVVISLGLGLTLFAGLALIEGNMARELNDQVPERAPAFFFLDIQKYQIDDFKKETLSIEGVDGFESVPSLRGQVTHINGTLVDELEVSSDFRWVIRGDRSLSYNDQEPKKSPVVKGDWWPVGYDGPPEISIGDEAATGLGINVGDTMTITILGREITFRVRSTREINWGGMGLNFVIMLDPNVMKAAPHSYMVTIRASGEAEGRAYNQLTKAFPAVTAIRVKEVLDKVNTMLVQIGTAIRATSLVAIVAGVFVLAGAIAAGFQQRVYDAVILKVVGAVRSQILRAYLLEYFVLGFITAVIALFLGSLAGYMVIVQVMDMKFTILPVPMIITVFVSLGITITFGLMSSIKSLAVRPNQVLRGE